MVGAVSLLINFVTLNNGLCTHSDLYLDANNCGEVKVVSKDYSIS
jgi:hypothetical protein